LARARDAIRVERFVVDGDVLSLAKIRGDAQRLGAVTEDLLDVALPEARRVPRAMTADARRDARFDDADPPAPFVLVGHVGGREARDTEIHHATRDVVAAAGLDDHVLRDGNAADRDAVAQVRVRHQVEADDARIDRRLCGLPPQRLVGLLEQGGRQERVHVHAHVADARQHVVAVGHALDSLAKRHGVRLLVRLIRLPPRDRDEPFRLR